MQLWNAMKTMKFLTSSGQAIKKKKSADSLIVIQLPKQLAITEITGIPNRTLWKLKEIAF